MAVCYKSVLAGGGSGQSMHVDTLTITTQPTKTTYIQGEKIDTTGMVVTASAYGMSGTVTPYVTVSPQILGTAGTQTITVSFGDAEATYTVTVEALVSVSITTPPTTTAYVQGSTLDLTGIVVTATSANLSRDVTTSCTFSPANGSILSTTGSITVTASFGGMSDTTSVTSYAIEGIEITTPPTKTVYAEDETLDLTGIVVSAIAGTVTSDVTSQCTFNPANGTVLTTEGNYNITATYLSFTATTPYSVITVGTLENTSWAKIKQIGSLGQGSQYWSIGDTKTITLNGTVGTVSLSNFQCKVYILDFNYREDNGIYFRCFKSMSDSKLIALCDSYYSTSMTDGTKAFNYNHYSKYDYNYGRINPNYGGWKGCDLRYDILGSTDVAPSEYEQVKTSANVGYDATSTCATNPVPNTLMSALPSDLRAVLAPWIIYTDNIGGGAGNIEANVTASVDYLPLLGGFEVWTSVSEANVYEQNYQYRMPSETEFVRYDDQTVAIEHWTRSPNKANYVTGIRIGTIGTSNGLSCSISAGIAPAFRVA